MRRFPDRPSGSQIARWVPERGDQVCGNEGALVHFRAALASGSLVNTFLTGDSRSGKTSLARWFARAFGCPNRGASLDACGREDCRHCQDFDGRTDRGDWGTFAAWRGSGIDYWMVDCTRLTSEDVDRLHREIAGASGSGVRLVVLDEAFRLAKRQLDERFLKLLEEDCSFLACSVACEGLDPRTGGPDPKSPRLDVQFLNRFPARLATQLPGRVELAKWAMDRARGWEIGCEDPSLWLKLADASGRLPGKALGVLALAADRGRMLTGEVLNSASLVAPGLVLPHASGARPMP